MTPTTCSAMVYTVEGERALTAIGEKGSHASQRRLASLTNDSFTVKRDTADNDKTQRGQLDVSDERLAPSKVKENPVSKYVVMPLANIVMMSPLFHRRAASTQHVAVRISVLILVYKSLV